MLRLSEEILRNLGITKRAEKESVIPSVPSVDPSPTLTVDDLPEDAIAPDDVDALRNKIYERVREAVLSHPPIVYGDYSLKIEKADYADPPVFPVKKEHEAIVTGRDMYRRLVGEVALYDNRTNQKIAQRKLTLARVPYVSRLGPFILNGNSYMLANQQRMRPGIYVRVRENGEIEAFVNVAGGAQHEYEMDPEKGVFYLRMRQARIPLISFLRALGVKDEQLRQAWGDELYNVNAKAVREHDVYRMFPGVRDQESFNAALQEFLEKSVLDPSTTALTLGRPFERLTPEAILLATRKMLDVYQKKVDPDERDSLFFQSVVRPDGLLYEAASRGLQQLRKYVMRAVRKGGDLSVIPSAPLDGSIRSLFFGSGVGELIEEINPGEIYDRLHRVIKTGAGGIENTRAIPQDARALHPSQMGYIDPVVTAAQARVGVDNRLAWNTRVDSNGKLYALYKDVRNDKFVWRAPNDVYDAVVAFPGELKSKKPFVLATRRGQVWYFKPEEVDYELPYGEQYFTPIINFVPAIASIFPQRLILSHKTQLQAVPLVHREAPLVRGKLPDSEKSFQEHAARFYGAVFSDVPGTVERVTNDEIVIRTNKGTRKTFELFNDYPFNRKTFITSKPVVKVGDAVTKGSLLATSNYTDDKGVPAFGINAYTAIIPYRGYNFEDAYVISESFAKKLASEAMYQETLDISDDLILGKDAYRSIFPGRYDSAFYDKYDENGILKPGQTVRKGEPLILAVREARLDRQAGKKRYFVDASVTWDHDAEGQVVSNYAGKKFYYVNAKTVNATRVGDKLTGRFGDKGIIATVVPDEKMPRDSKGVPFDLLMNPLGLISRANQNQIYEMLLGKIAKQRGQPYNLPAFMDDFYRYVDGEMRAHGVTPVDTVYDPELGITIPNVMTGHKYVMKLHHMAESKLQERSTEGYTAELTPARGGKEGAKRIGLMELTALLGHNAFHVIRDAKLIRGQENQAFWLDFMRGGTPLVRDQPFVYDKFVSLLKGAGINMTSDNNYIHLFALTNSDIKKLTSDRRINNPETVRFSSDDIKVIDGGLFDERLTGGLRGTFWSYIQLPEPMPSPVMEEVIRTFLDLTEQQYADILAGKAPAPLSGIPGPEGIRKDLTLFNVDRAIADTMRQLKVAPQTARSRLVRKLRYLLTAKRHNQNPAEWVWERFPVLPPVFRPVSVAGGGLIVADVNALYQDLYEAADILAEQKTYTDDLADARLALYRAMKAVAGLGEPIQAAHKQQELKGLLKQIMGPSHKWNYVLRKLLSFTTDLTGRAVIAPNPSLNIDQIALPEPQAWVIFKPFIIRGLVKRGVPLVEAIRNYEGRTNIAREELLRVMNERVVLMNRAPVLHRFGFMAFYPVLTQNNVIEINPQIVSSFGADFDGDAVQVHVPVSEEAQREAREKMLPSRNLFSPGTFGIMYPAEREYAMGLWLASVARKSKPPKVFKSKEEAIKAYKQGKIAFDDPIIVHD